jgi:ribose transport system permease protein
MVMCGSLITTEINGVADGPAALAVAIGRGLLTAARGCLAYGLTVAYLGFTAFIATLITSQIWEGLTLKRSNGQPIYNLVQDNFVSFGQGDTFGIPNVIYVAGLVAALVWFLLDQTPLGRRMYAVGGNADAARYSGIDVKRTKLLAFVIAGLGAAVAGILISANNGTASLNGPPALMLPSIAAVFLGMAVLRDGRPNLPGTILGVVMLRVLESGLNQSGVDSYTLQIVSAVVVFIAVLPSALGRLRELR